MSETTLARRLAAEALGTALLLATVVGSGIMAEKLAGGNVAIALLGNTLPTGAILVVLITILGPVSGAHFNPVVTAVMAARGQIASTPAILYVATQCAAAVAGVVLAHAMFDLPLAQLSTKVRSSPGQWIAEAVATFGLIVTIFGAIRHRPDAVAMLVGLYITSAYWFTASTSFANPAVTLARCFTDTFAGIAPAGASAFIAAQAIGAVAGSLISRGLFPATTGRS
jgi:glycerol uptake facilitator-like aquaporin